MLLTAEYASARDFSSFARLKDRSSLSVLSLRLIDPVSLMASVVDPSKKYLERGIDIRKLFASEVEIQSPNLGKSPPGILFVPWSMKFDGSES
jgi:hypothetical protein